MTSSPEKFSVRPFRPADRDALQSLWARVFPDDPPWNAPEVMIENKLKVQPELLLIGEVDSTLVGGVMAGFDGVRGWIYHLAIAPEFRRRGFATQLVRAAEAGLRTLGCPKVNLQIRATNHDVVAFYERIGYRLEERVSMGRRLEHLMPKRLQVYETPGITVTFDPNVCTHSGSCVRGLPAVFDVSRQHWIKPELASPEAVAAQVARCPSGALQSERPGGTKADRPEED